MHWLLNNRAHVFKEYDDDGSGTMDITELGHALHAYCDWTTANRLRLERAVRVLNTVCGAMEKQIKAEAKVGRHVSFFKLFKKGC